MNAFLTNLALIAMLGVLVVLGLGIFSLAKGGTFRESWSNKLMRLRVLLQAVAIVLLCVLLWWRTTHSG
ncbi:twin transmembrane helix small protein [Asticcacaulis endophyticus]|nr:twin transmembrane helix small protein [Asticcacaulis endophyticus]